MPKVSSCGIIVDVPFFAKLINVRLRIDTFPKLFPQSTELQDASLSGLL